VRLVLSTRMRTRRNGNIVTRPSSLGSEKPGNAVSYITHPPLVTVSGIVWSALRKLLVFARRNLAVRIVDPRRRVDTVYSLPRAG